MYIPLGERFVIRPPTSYKPSNGFENFLGNNPIRVLKIETPILEKGSKIKNLQVLSLEMRSGFTRRIALLEAGGKKVLVYFYQDDYEPKREEQHDGKDCLPHKIFGNTATVGQIRVIPTMSEKNKDRDLLFDADQLAFQLASDFKTIGLKGDDNIRLSGSGVVVVTDLDRDRFLESQSIQQAIGELFKENGIFKNNLIIPGINKENNHFINNIKLAGGMVLNMTKNIQNLQDLFHSLILKVDKEMEFKNWKKLFNKIIAFSVYVPFLEKLWEDKETRLGNPTFQGFVEKILQPKIKEIYNELI